MQVMLGIGLLLALPAWAEFEAVDRDGRIEIRDGEKLVFGWQVAPLDNPKGGEVFAASAFIHPLCTPSGFELTSIQPDDHLHHLGLWWPWKMLTVDGKKHITWEMQEKQGQHVAVAAKVVEKSADEVLIEATNRSLIGEAGVDRRPVLDEQVRLRFFRIGKDAYGLDIHITQQPVRGIDVTVTRYHYSGLSWRGASEWTKENSVMLTSAGLDRDHANGNPANWVTVEGTTPRGRATMLMMSAAAKDDGRAERLRVWDSKMHGGAPFVNFNPVMGDSIALKPEHKEVSDRHYRLVIADRSIAADEVDRLWGEWGGR